MVSLLVVRVLSCVARIVYRTLITIVCVIRRIVIVAVYDALAWLAHLQVALLAKYLARHH